MKPVNEVYKGGFFKNRNRLAWRAPIVGQALINTYNLTELNTVIDVGCGIGDYVQWLNNAGIITEGIEGSTAAKPFFVSDKIKIWDLRKPLPDSTSRYDVVFSMEVAEHIEPFYAGVYVDNLCRLSDTILISAASPGQKGHGHLNCVPKGYWISFFKERNFIQVKGVENRWKNALRPYQDKKELSSYYKNVIAFRRINGKF